MDLGALQIKKDVVDQVDLGAVQIKKDVVDQVDLGAVQIKKVLFKIHLDLSQSMYLMFRSPSLLRML